MKKQKIDALYSTPMVAVRQFVFDEQVARVFEDMLDRSVPGYQDIVKMIGVLAARYAKEGSFIYDLGCSLGAVTLAMQSQISLPNVKIIAVDNSAAMVKKCRENSKQVKAGVAIEVLLENIEDIQIRNASFVVLNFTLQFIEPKKRVDILKKICQGLLPNGILILSEKIDFDRSEEKKFQIDLHHTFKRLKGYSDLEISQKRSALENILIPETLQNHQDRLREAGFHSVYTWFQCFNFASLIAIKG